MNKLIFMFLFISTLLKSQVGSQIGNILTINKCQDLIGVQTDFYTLISMQVGKPAKKIGDYLTSTSAPFIPSYNNTNAKFVSSGCIIPERFCIEEYIINGDSLGTSTPSINNLSNPTVGKTVLITSTFRSLAWNYTYGTLSDPGNGTIAKVKINGFTYYPTSTNYNIDGYSYSGFKDQKIESDFLITATGKAVVKIVVVKQNCE